MVVRKVTTVEHYCGLSTDTKPSAVPPGSTFFETDTGLTMLTTDDGTTWVDTGETP